MAIEKELPDVDPLFVGMTRPAMLWGVTYSYFMLNGMFVTIGFLGTNSLWFLLAAAPLHVIGYAACKHDPHVFELLFKRFNKCPPVSNASHWKCNTYEAH